MWYKPGSFAIYYFQFAVWMVDDRTCSVLCPQSNRERQSVNPERVLMEVAELKTMIGELEARVEKIRDWL